MTSRERVIRAIEHRETDRMPIDLGLHFSTGISAFAYKNLRDYLGFDSSNIEMPDVVQCLARVDDDVLDRLHIDTKLLWPKPIKPHRFCFRDGYEFTVTDRFRPVFQEDGYLVAQKGSQRMRMPKGGFFFDGAWPDFYADSFEEKVGMMLPEAEKIYKDSDRFTMFMEFEAFCPDLDFMCDMYTEPEEVVKRQEKKLEELKKQAGYLAKTMGSYIQAVSLNSDLGSQNAPLCSPAMYGEYVAPYLKELCKTIKNVSDYKIFLHSCGSIEPLIPILIDCGIEILNPVQISAENMNPHQLKEKYGNKLTFWGGGCNTQQILNLGSVEQVEKNVRELIHIFAPGGGHVFNQVHNIMGDIAPEKITAMFDTAYDEAKKMEQK